MKNTTEQPSQSDLQRQITELKSLVSDLRAKNEAQKAQLVAYEDRFELLRKIDLEILAASSPRDIAQVVITHLYQYLHGYTVSMSFFEAASGQRAESPYDGVVVHMQTHPEILEVELVTLQKGQISIIRGQSAQIGAFLMRVPLISDGELIGSINLSSNQHSTPEDEVRQTLLQIADQLSIAMQQSHLHQKTRRQLDELSLLYAIALAAVQARDVPQLLSNACEILNQHLYRDSFVIGLINTENKTLDFFTPNRPDLAYPYAKSIPLGVGVAGKVIRQGVPILIPDIRLEADYIGDNPHIRSELCLPIKIGADVVGIINVESTRGNAFSVDDERFLLTIAGQLSGAIEKSQLLHDLQKSNYELSQAYDATLEGWAKALEMRDNETEGHSQRVTVLAVKLAIEMGIPENQITDFYRGALLHDIGKMGIPDRILQKPGKLDDAEWKIMRRHPEIALDLLSRIPFLVSTVDIPYYHHERWDGSGYPKGLKGEEIPLVARIFAVVDVWDSLVTDRPYSAAWPKKRAQEYIEGQAGILFDPKVVETFFKYIENWIF